MNFAFLSDIPSTSDIVKSSVPVIVWIIVAVLVVVAIVAIVKIAKKRGRK